MLVKLLLASSTLLTRSLLVQADVASGKAIIENACRYPVYVDLVPDPNGDYQSSSFTLSPGQSYDQHHWTRLSPATVNGVQIGGWSFKFKTDPNTLSDIFQLEYKWPYPDPPYTDGQSVSWDLSCSEGDPFQGNWRVSSSRNLVDNEQPRQACYRFWNDDANGMQPNFELDVDLTLKLCAN